MKILTEINDFGGTDADNDNLLLDCFEDHEAYLNVINFTKFLVSGRKGSGKTAIYKKILLSSNYDFFTFGHTFSDYPWNYHDLQVKIGIPDQDKYTHSWKYLILLTISKILLNYDQSVPFDDVSIECLLKIEKFIIDTYGTKDPDVTHIFTPTKILKLKPHFEIDAKLLKAGISPESVPMTELPTIVQEVNHNLLNYVLKSLNPKNRYCICFDQLDLGFDPSSSEYNFRLIGLLLAAREINLKAKELNKNLFISIFLRDDIYDNLHFEDKNKITQNFMSIIEWDSSKTKKTLKGLMEKRFTKLLKNQENESIKWEDIFDEDKKMTGKQTKYQYILDRTFLRPRDIIKFCNEILNQFRFENQNKNPTDQSTKFENKDINNAKSNYSDYLLKELDDEIHKHIPYYKQSLDIIKKIGYTNFTLEEFTNLYNEIPNEENIKTTEILNNLFEFSIIGYYNIGGAGYGGSKNVFKYRDSTSKFDEKAEFFYIHSGLIEVLQLRRRTS